MAEKQGDGRARNGRPSTTPEVTPDVYSMFDREDRDDDRKLRRALAFAVAFHAILLWVTLPSWNAQAVDHEKKEKKVYVVEQIRFKQPEIIPQEIPKKKKLRVPMPDPTPDAPEPMVVDMVPEVELDTDFEPDFPLPDAPPAPPAPSGPILVGDGIEPPVRTHYVQPEYTEIARRTRVQGVVILQATIDKQGQVRDIKVLKGLGMGLTEEAERAVRQWRFAPSTYNGKPVEVLYNLTVNYKLQ